LQIKDAQFKQKQRQTEIAFQMEQIRKNTEAKNNLSQQEQVHRQEMVHAAAEKIMELMNAAQQPEKTGENEAEK